MPSSAATIWLVAAIGMIVGAGYPLLALTATAIVFVILHFLTRMEGYLRRGAEQGKAGDLSTGRSNMAMWRASRGESRR